ncbi:hypothetical protein [Ramlibacter alkalitolerans]|uniref:Major facilitator superfamily (MFS) profile domain-containing protein n=1 Tax=Ramlibacter alkalitolerans TaxID=2039631 RepID=A0ABS1JQ08_9BURK|nr:hypothetical protein [Ramlibacter alkalitolerans]MBL0426303.1 hypothetical protein [Ramlibacter alkalitolerans]
MTPAREQFVAGALAIAVGAAVALAMLYAPGGARAPAWVIYAAAGAFVLAGLTLIAQGTGRRLLARWLPALVIACLVAPAAWIALGAGPRRCLVSVWASGGRLLGRHSDLLCRLAFGAGAVLGLLMLLLAVREALRNDLDP